MLQIRVSKLFIITNYLLYNYLVTNNYWGSYYCENIKIN